MTILLYFTAIGKNIWRTDSNQDPFCTLLCSMTSQDSMLIRLSSLTARL